MGPFCETSVSHGSSTQIQLFLSKMVPILEKVETNEVNLILSIGNRHTEILIDIEIAY
jgi:hypothetical protein